MKAIYNQDGSARFVWVKKAVSSKKAMFYSGSPGYSMLYNNDRGDAVYGFRRILDEDSPIPSHLEICSDEEVNKLEKQNKVVR